jgi:hypothetical protein
MKRIIVFLSLSLCLSLGENLRAQSTFQIELNYSNNDAFNACIENTQGNFILAGSIENAGTNYDALFVEMSPSGTILNTVVIATNDYEIVKSITQTADGGYFVCGSVFSNPNNYDWMVMKLDASFAVSWYQRIGDAAGNDNANSAFEISPGHYTVVGSTFLAGATKPAVVTFDASGGVINEAYLNTNQFASPDYRGKYFGNGLIGINHLANGLCIVDTVGNVVSNWNQKVGNYSWDVISTNNGRYASISSANAGPIGTAVGFTVLNSGLNAVIASRTYSDTGDNMEPVQIMDGSNQDFFIAANFSSNSSGNYNPFLIHIDSLGSLSTCNNFTPSTAVNAQFNAGVRTSDGGYLLVGSSGVFGAQQLYVVKTDGTGNACSSPTQSINTSIPSSVSATLHAPFSTNLLPAVQQVSINSTAALQPNVFCIVTQAKEILPTNSFLQNNISSDGLYIINQPLNQNGLLRAYDLSGKLVMEEIIDPFETQLLTKLQPGSYLFVLSETNGNVFARQKVIQF